MTISPILQANRLGWTKNDSVIVSDVSLAVARGEMVGLIGPNGSGKSTLLSMLAGLLTPSHGDVHLDGRPLRSLRRREVAQFVAFVSQQAETADRITVKDAVELGRTPWLSALRPWSPEDERAVLCALEAVSMDHMVDHDWSSLSGGERQRVHIARAHAQAPQLLILDEPTNHLDIHHQLAILDLIKSLSITTIVALHDMHHAMRCDRLLVMKDGQCAALGPPADILTGDLIREIFHVDAYQIPDPRGGPPVFSFRPLA